MKRIGIFFMYDRDGIVDDYIPVMLRDLQKNIERFVIVINGKLTNDGQKKLSEFSDEIIVRENEGYDVWAYKTGLEYIGYDNLSDYDELVMFNHTMMGPIYPFAEMFDQMGKKEVDFWGISQFYKTDFDPFGTMPKGYIPDHIQSYFITARKSLSCSADFKKYWDEMPMITGYLDSISRHETRFTKHFEHLGYRWSVYVDAEKYKGMSFQPMVAMPTEMIKVYHSPIFKRRTFMQDYNVVLGETAGETAYELWNYLEEETDYNLNLIWDNLLRLENMADLKKNLQWNYVLPSKYSNPKTNTSNFRIALFMHIYFGDLIDDCKRYVESMPDNADIYITTNNEKQAEEIREKYADIPCGKLTVKTVPNSGRDVGPFLVEVQDHLDEYDIICHAHDKKAGQVTPGTIGLSFAYKCFENTLGSKDYVKNIIGVFEENPRAGLLMPPPPNHGEYYITLAMEWGANYSNTKKLMRELQFTAPMDEGKEPIAALGSYFWARTDALRPVFEHKRWTYDSFPAEPLPEDGTYLHAIERIYPFAAQSKGYYAGWILKDSNAAMEITNLNHMVRELNKPIFFEGQGAGNWNHVRLGVENSYRYIARRGKLRRVYMRIRHIIGVILKGDGIKATKKKIRRFKEKKAIKNENN